MTRHLKQATVMAFASWWRPTVPPFLRPPRRAGYATSASPIGTVLGAASRRYRSLVSADR